MFHGLSVFIISAERHPWHASCAEEGGHASADTVRGALLAR